MAQKEKLEEAKRLYQTANADQRYVLESLFPELKESKDERIRKELIEFVKSRGGFKQEYIAWLEKQGEKKLADKVKPKFHEGEWITNGDYTWKIVEINPLDYILQSQDGNMVDDTISHVDEQFHSFTIEDANDGDVLVASDGSLFIFARAKDNAAYYHFSLSKNGSKEISDGKHAWETANSCHPATKEQRDLLEKAMVDAGYTFDFEKKELKKIEQNSAWSREDEKMVANLVDYFKVDDALQYTEKQVVDWLKSLKQRIAP